MSYLPLMNGTQAHRPASQELSKMAATDEFVSKDHFALNASAYPNKDSNNQQSYRRLHTAAFDPTRLPAASIPTLEQDIPTSEDSIELSKLR